MHGIKRSDELLVRNGVLEPDLRRNAAREVDAVLKAAAPRTTEPATITSRSVSTPTCFTRLRKGKWDR